MGLETNGLFISIRDYFKHYLPAVKRSSPNTIRAYQITMDQLLDYVKKACGVKLYEVTFTLVTKKMVQSFLEHLETECACSPSTRNHRLLCIRAFYKFAASNTIEAVAYWNDLQSIPKVREQEKPIKHMSITAVECILAQPDARTDKGLRDMALIMFLYQTGARVQELVNIQLRDLRLEKTPVVTLHGKGSKVRCVPLRDKLVQHLERYLSIFHPDADKYSEEYLFYVHRNGCHSRMSEDNVRRMVQKYGDMAHEQLSEVPIHIHPHMFRHSRAMHLYQNGVSLPLVSQWLGHSRLDTTLIYAHADTEQKRKAIEKAIPEESTLKLFLNSDRYCLDDEDMIKRLYGLK